MPKIIQNIEERILVQAEELFLSQGYPTCDLRQIARKADIAVGTIYHYYKNKEDLYIHVLAFSWKKTIQKLAEIASEDLKPELLLNKMILLLIHDISSRKPLSGLWTEISTLYREGDTPVMHHNHFMNMHADIAKVFSQVILRMLPAQSSEKEKLAADRLGSFTFVMAVDICMLPAADAQEHVQVICDLIHSYASKTQF
jgi:AcrR family transcriptional regulator